MSRIFEKIGVQVVWAEDPKAAPQSVVALIVPDARAAALRIADTEALAVTLGDERPGGCVYLFFGRVERTAAQHRVDTSFVLGSAQAHETAHFLLHGNAHGRSGLMRASWGDQEFRLMRGGMLLFSRGEGEAIRDQTRTLTADGRMAP